MGPTQGFLSPLARAGLPFELVEENAKTLQARKCTSREWRPCPVHGGDQLIGFVEGHGELFDLTGADPLQLRIRFARQQVHGVIQGPPAS
jgi:hypothetical protein